MPSGSLYLIPSYLHQENDAQNITERVKEVIKQTDYFLVENIRTARRFISSLKLGLTIESLEFIEMDKRFDQTRLSEIMKPLDQGRNIGVISEAGLPGIADPGHLAVSYAHRNEHPVVPLEGGSSIILALISSGFNGQSFTFHGYLPIDKAKQLVKIKSLESDLNKTKYTQLFMETPYRNNQLFKSLTQNLSPKTELLIASDITGSNQIILSKTIENWRKTSLDLHKKPCIFGIGYSL